MARLDKYFKDILDMSGDALHLGEGSIPKVHVGAQLMPLNHQVLAEGLLASLLEELCTAQQWQGFSESGDFSFVHSYKDRARFQANFSLSVLGLKASFKLIATPIPSLKNLGVPACLNVFSKAPSGLVLIIGPAGSGKSTTLAAIIDSINTTQSKNILTIEDSIQFIHTSKKSFTTQRQIGRDASSLIEALGDAQDQNLDIILIEEVHTAEEMRLALVAAENGILVFASLSTRSTLETLDWILNDGSTEDQEQVRSLLTRNLKGICAQLLVQTHANKSRQVLYESFTVTPKFKKALQSEGLSEIEKAIQEDHQADNLSIDEQLLKLAKGKTVLPRVAYSKAHNKKLFSAFYGDTKR